MEQFSGDSAASSPGVPQVKPLLPAPHLRALRDRRVLAADPRRILTTALAVTAFVTASAAGIRLAADPLARADLLDLLFVPQPSIFALRLTAIGVALLVGVATLASLRRVRR